MKYSFQTPAKIIQVFQHDKGQTDQKGYNLLKTPSVLRQWPVYQGFIYEEQTDRVTVLKG